MLCLMSAGGKDEKLNSTGYGLHGSDRSTVSLFFRSPLLVRDARCLRLVNRATSCGSTVVVVSTSQSILTSPLLSHRLGQSQTMSALSSAKAVFA
jgi:hypothetical protein